MADECAIEATTCSSLASAVPNTLNIVNNEQNNEHHKIRNEKPIYANMCQPVSVVLERLSQEVCKDLHSRIKKNQNQFKNSTWKAYKEEEKVNNAETVLTLDGYKLRSRNKNHMSKQNSCDCNDTTMKQVFKNRRNIDTWKYKRKYNDSFSEEYVKIPDISTKLRKKRKSTELKFKQNNNKFTIGKLHSHTTYSNIIDAKVMLTKLEDMHDNKYVIDWKNKLMQQALLTTNLEYNEQYRNLSTSTSSINNMINSHEDPMKDIENNTSAKKSLSTYDLKSKYKLSTNLKVMLVKLESLGVSLEEQNLASKVEQSMTNYSGIFKLHSVTCSNNIVNNINESINEASVQMSSSGKENDASVQMSTSGKENDVVNQHSTNEPAIDSSLSNSILHNVSNLKELSKKSDNGTDESESMKHQESTKNEENVDKSENAEVFKEPVVEIDESAILPKPADSVQDIVTETPVNNEAEMVDCSNNVVTEVDVNNTNLITNLTTEAQKINEFDSVDLDVSLNSESLEQSINNSFLYTCIACKSSFKEFRALPLHLKKCLAKSQKTKNDHGNNNKCNMSDDSAKIAETLECGDISKSSLQQSSSAANDGKLQLTLTKKLLKGKSKNLKLVKKHLKDRTNVVQCTICSEVFDTIESLSDHIYKHTELELQKAYEVAKTKQIPVLGDSNKKKKIAVTSTKHKKAQATNITIEQKKTQVNEASNTSQSLIPGSQKRKVPSINYVSPMIFCDCHKPESNDVRCIELVLQCSACKTIFRTKECFDAHFERAMPSSCGSKQLIGTMQRLYCSACKITLYSFVDMRQHTENHIKNQKYIMLFCHICKVRFIGMGPIFNLHWFNHMRNLNFMASAANFPKTSLVDSNNKIWSLINSDNYNYLIVMEHVCSFCNEQFFAMDQLQNHIPICPKRKNIELSRAILVNNDKEHNIDSGLNLRFFCTLCKIMFKEKSLFETHAVSHKQHLQPQYICLSMADIKRTYICNVCANVYDNLTKFKTHWQDHNAIRETFICYQCKRDFPTLEKFEDHSKQCDVSSIPVNLPSCQVTYCETTFNCKICNIGFESYKALYQHTAIHNTKISKVSVICHNETQNELIEQTISPFCPKTIPPDKEQVSISSKDSTAKVIVTDSNVAEKKDSMPEVLKDVIDTRTQSRSSTESKTVECLESEADNISVNDMNISDADTEILSLLSDVEADDLSKMEEENCSDKNDKSNNSISKDKGNEMITASNISPSNMASVTHLSSNEKTDLNETSSTLQNLEINETDMENDVILIEHVITNKETENAKKKSPVKVSKKKNDIPKETTSDPKPNDSSESNNKMVKVPKYLRVKNISELMDQTKRALCSKCGLCFDTEESLSNHMMTHNQELTSVMNIPIFLPNFLSGADVTQQNANRLTNSDPLNLQQGSQVVVQQVPAQQQTFIPYSVSQVTQQNTSMPLAPSCTTAYVVPTQDPNVQYSGLPIAPIVHNANITIKTNGTYVPPVSVQSQNFYQDKQILYNVLSSPKITDSPINFIDNNHLIQTSKASTAMLPNLLANNVVSNQDYLRAQPQDTHSRIKLQNAIHQRCSDKTPNVTAINVLSKSTPTSSLKHHQTPCLPISSSNQYCSNESFSTISSFMGVANSQKNNNMPIVNTDNSGQMSTSYNSLARNSNVASSSIQQHAGPDKSSASSAVYVCHYCPQGVYFSTMQQFDDHLNSQHNYSCEICNERYFIYNELFHHKLKHNSTYTQNTFQS